MRKSIILIVALVFAVMLVGAGVFAESHGHSMGAGCSYCGMDLMKFAHTAMKIVYDDGTEANVCSIHCGAIDMALNIDKTPKDIMVGDFGTKKMTDAEAAFWVIDAKSKGVMTTRAKWAFADKADAEKYVKANYGDVVSFDDAMKAAYEDMYADTQMIRKMRKMKSMKH